MSAPALPDERGLPGGRDGVVQLLLDGDYAFYQATGAAWAATQLQVIALVDAVFAANLGVPLEVVEQHVWTTPDPFTGPICAGGESNRLEQFRAHWEAASPTLSDPREDALLVSRLGSYSGYWGCAYVATLESPWAYAMAWLPFMGPFGGVVPRLHDDVAIVAHELGHNFGGLHERAFPTPGSVLDRGCDPPHSIMYPCVEFAAPWFSDAHGVGSGPLEALGVLQDGGNAPWMREHAAGRV